MTAPIDRLLERLPSAKPDGENKWKAFCPIHENPPDGHERSLCIKLAGNTVLVYCQACGKSATPAIIQALGLTMKDLFPADTVGKPRGKSGGDGKAPPAPIVAVYDYRDSAGVLRYQVVRKADKEFPQRRPDGNGAWAWALTDGEYVKGKDGDWYTVKKWTPADAPRKQFPATPRLLYRLPELLTADKGAWVFIVEGEKDADALAVLGLVATTNPGGAGKWGKLSDDSSLHGRRVAIVPDRDRAGLAHAQDVAARLHGKAAVVKIIDLPDMPAKDDGLLRKDVSDWVGWLDGKTGEELAAALVNMAESAPPWTPQAGAKVEAKVKADGVILPAPVLTCLADVKPEPVRWLWPGRIPFGKVSVLTGDPGLGKSLTTLDMAARVSRGQGFPDCPEATGEPGGVVLLSAEDDAADTIVPRLIAAGADLGRIVKLDAVRIGDRERAFNLDDDLPALEAAIVKTPYCRLVIIDPISAYLGGRIDSHRNAEVRAVLAPLAELAARHGVAVVLVMHLNKGQGPAMYRTSGSLGFVAAARAVYAFGKDKDDPSGQRRFMLPVKCNLAADAGGLAYRLHFPDGSDGQPVIAWEPDPVSITADEALSIEPGRGDAEGAKEREAMDWLRAVLGDGPKAAEDLIAQAKNDGISARTLYRAKAKLKIVASKARGVLCGPWTWGLPEGCQQDRQASKPANPGNLGNLRENTGKTEDSGRPESEGCQVPGFGNLRPGNAPSALTEPGPQAQEPTGQEAPAQEVAPSADTTPRPATSPTAARPDLDPDRPGPLDFLTAEQRKRYQGMYVSCPASMHPTEKHARAWRYALGDGPAMATMEAQA